MQRVAGAPAATSSNIFFSNSGPEPLPRARAPPAQSDVPAWAPAADDGARPRLINGKIVKGGPSTAHGVPTPASDSGLFWAPQAAPTPIRQQYSAPPPPQQQQQYAAEAEAYYAQEQPQPYEAAAAYENAGGAAKGGYIAPDGSYVPGGRATGLQKSSNAYASGANQNCGNVLTDRPTSR
jgi:hypothetical protein